MSKNELKVTLNFRVQNYYFFLNYANKKPKIFCENIKIFLLKIKFIF